MAYLNCPFCPAQAVPNGEPLRYTQYLVLQMFKCVSKHRFYVEKEEIADEDSLHRRSKSHQQTGHGGMRMDD